MRIAHSQTVEYAQVCTLTPASYVELVGTLTQTVEHAQYVLWPQTLRMFIPSTAGHIQTTVCVTYCGRFTHRSYNEKLQWLGVNDRMG